MIRRVWGNISTGHVTVDVVTDLGRPEQNHIQRQIPLMEKDAVVRLEVKKGRRQQPIAEAKLADLRDKQAELSRSVLAQQYTPVPVDPAALASYYRDVRRMAGRAGAVNRGFLRNPAVGFQPQISVLPEGASLTALAITSADRRYVRISPSPVFSQIGQIDTFNFVDGSGTTQGGGGGGGFGGGGGGGFGGGGNL